MDQIASSIKNLIDFVSALAERYQISAICPFLDSCRAAATRHDLNVAVLGRFKAGKSSFLNCLIGRNVLPVGVIPVTSVVTEIAVGPADLLKIEFTDGHEISVPLEELRSYVSEAENPENRKNVLRAVVFVPEISRWRGVCFVDTPGLESAFAHNTEASLAWAPNVDIALVAIGVDPPLTQQDIQLITKLKQYTPRIAILLTKVDILAEADLPELLHFVRTQVSEIFKAEIPIFPFSVRAEYKGLREQFEKQFLAEVASDLVTQRTLILTRKLETLLNESEGYLRLTLRSSELLDSERVELLQKASAEKEILADTKLGIQLAARNAVGITRGIVEKALAPCEAEVRNELITAFEAENSTFPKSFARMLEAFDKWLNANLTKKLLERSRIKRNEFAKPLVDVQRQYRQVLQRFRDQLSEQTEALYGVPLRTTEPDIHPEPPKMPDVKIGRAFDHNWELVSPVIPMFVLRRAVLKRFRRKIADETFKNLSRLSTQWNDIIVAAIFQLQREAEKRIDDLLTTVERLTSSPRLDMERIRGDLRQLNEFANELRNRG